MSCLIKNLKQVIKMINQSKKKKKGHRQLNKIRKKVEEQNETINKEIKKIYFKKEQTRNPGVKNTVIALKKSLEVFNSRLD